MVGPRINRVEVCHNRAEAMAQIVAALRELRRSVPVQLSIAADGATRRS